MGNQVRTLRTLSTRERKRKLTVKQKKKTEKVKTGKSFESPSRTAILSTIFEDKESESDIKDIAEEENNNKERIVNRIPEVSSEVENEDNKNQPGETETRETLEIPEITETPEIITEDNVNQIIEGLLTEGISLSDLLESGITYYYYFHLHPPNYHAV